MSEYRFSQKLQAKIDSIKKNITPIKIGKLTFSSKLIMAPLASITTGPYRQLISDLGAGFTFTELISAHAINYKNEKTLRMLDPSVGIQLFAEAAAPIVDAGQYLQAIKPILVDINIGCPVRKVCQKGAGAALLNHPEKIEEIFKEMKANYQFPISAKIRLGNSPTQINAPSILHLAEKFQLEFVTIHGRTRDQFYSGNANWNLIEELALQSKIPIIGNGDLFTKNTIINKLKNSNCQAFMLARGPLRNPFLFLEPFNNSNHPTVFTAHDRLEVLRRFNHLLQQEKYSEQLLIIQLKKHIVWQSMGYRNSVKFRTEIFQQKNHKDLLDLTTRYFQQIPEDESPELFADADAMTDLN